MSLRKRACSGCAAAKRRCDGGYGGYGEYALLREEAIVRLPSDADPAEIAPLLCAGVTVFNGMRKMGGAAMIVATAPNPKTIGQLVNGLQPGGKLLVHPIVEVDTSPLMKGISVCGWPSDHSIDSEEAVRFAQIRGINCMIERFPLADAQKAFEHMTSGKARFRAVLTM